MTKNLCCEKVGMNKGKWSDLEDEILTNYIKANGEGKWSRVPKQAGLKRCGKSCRLRWCNYLNPKVIRGNITPEEENIITSLHKEHGNRWSLIAKGLPGRTNNEIKNYWNGTLCKKFPGLLPKRKRRNSITGGIVPVLQTVTHNSLADTPAPVKSERTDVVVNPQQSVTRQESNPKFDCQIVDVEAFQAPGFHMFL